MKRRDFITKAATGVAGAGAIAAGCSSPDSGDQVPSVQTKKNVTWRLASSFSRSLDTIYGAAEVLAERVSALTGGRFRIRAYPGGELVPALEVLGAVQTGTVQMGHSASYYYDGKNPAFAFDTCVPFGLTARMLNGWFYYGGGLDLTRELFADFNIINFPGGNTGVQMGGWFRREINSLDDLKGLTMRIPGLGGKVMDRLGVNVQLISGGEIFPALERGAIDATEWAGPYDDEKLGFHKIVQNYYYPGWWEPGPGLSFYVNRNAWDTLPTDYQEALTSAAAEANVGMMAKYDAQNPPALQRLLAEGVSLRPFARDILEAARSESFNILEDFAAADAQYRKIFDSFVEFRRAAYRWMGTAELAFQDFAFRSAT
ncbi:MAG: TRAP transporter substrate-binding protein [Rhodothermia bacterium]|nr:TRAP transporter substrate-binding protein [Rhodothermia bacterium]